MGNSLMERWKKKTKWIEEAWDHLGEMIKECNAAHADGEDERKKEVMAQIESKLKELSDKIQRVMDRSKKREEAERKKREELFKFWRLILTTGLHRLKGIY